jgi:DNA (cytosine-5)-methyltransferase 1
MPRLTCDMVARLQGWYGPEYTWTFAGRKTSQYRQIGNAFPPPMARALASSIADALRKVEVQQSHPAQRRRASANVVSEVLLLTRTVEHDRIYRELRNAESYLTVADLVTAVGDTGLDVNDVRRRLELLCRDFVIDEIVLYGREAAYRLVDFRAFRGERDHARQTSFAAARARIS